jgi:hypothetical protein
MGLRLHMALGSQIGQKVEGLLQIGDHDAAFDD